MKTRHEKALARNAGQWLAAARRHLGWSEADLIGAIEALDDSDAPTRALPVVSVPTSDMVQNLEAGRERIVPIWVKSARMAVESAGLSDDDRAAWAATRNWWQPGADYADVFDCSYPLLLRREADLVAAVEAMMEEDRALFLRLANAWRSPYAQRKNVYRDAIRRIEAKLAVEDPPYRRTEITVD